MAPLVAAHQLGKDPAMHEKIFATNGNRWMIVAPMRIGRSILDKSKKLATNAKGTDALFGMNFTHEGKTVQLVPLGKLDLDAVR